MALLVGAPPFLACPLVFSAPCRPALAASTLALMSAAEIAWLDDYHARVWDEISPLVDDRVREWLFLATRPLDSQG